MNERWCVRNFAAEEQKEIFSWSEMRKIKKKVLEHLKCCPKVEFDWVAVAETSIDPKLKRNIDPSNKCFTTWG